MVDYISFHLVSPEKKLASIEAKAVTIPAMEGDITLLPDHADFLTTLKPGIIQIDSGSGMQEFLVTGGFIEVSKSVATILAEKAVPKTEANAQLLEPLIIEADEEYKNAPIHRKSRADLRLNDLKTLSTILN